MERKTVVIIVTYNSMEWIERCLTSVQNYPIIVIDNCSTDGTISYIKEQFSKVDLIESKENLGFAKANNIGIKKAYENEFDYFFLLNHDAWIQKDAIEKLTQIHQQNPNYGIISPVHLNGEGTLIDWNFTNYISNPGDQGRKLLTDLLLGSNLESLYSINFVNAASWCISRSCVSKVGLFDDELFIHYGEDDNYVRRARYHHFRIGIIPDVFIHHDRESRSGKKQDNNLTRQRVIEEFVSVGTNILDNNAIHEMKVRLKTLKKSVLKDICLLKVKKAFLSVQLILELKTYRDKIVLKRKEYISK